MSGPKNSADVTRADTSDMPMVCATAATEHRELRITPNRRAVLRAELVGIEVGCIV